MHRRFVQHDTYLLKVPGSGRRWRRLVAGISLIGLALLLFVGQKNLVKLLSLYQERKEVAARIEDLKSSNQRLQRQIQDLRVNPLAVEPIAREELGLAYPGELIYRFVQPKAPARNRE